MVSSASAVEEAALKNGLSLKSKMAQEDESQTGSVKNGVVTDESSQNSVTSEKEKAQNGAATNGDVKKDAESEDEDYDVQEFDEPEEPVVVIDDDDDEVPEVGVQGDNDADRKDKPEEGDAEMKDVKEEEKDEANKPGKDEISEKVEKLEKIEKVEKAEKPEKTKKATQNGCDSKKDSDEQSENDENQPQIKIVRDVRRLDKGLPKFLRRRVKVGQWTPCDMPRNGELKMKDSEALVEVPSLTCPMLIKEKDVFARRLKDGKVIPPKPRKTPVHSQNQFKLGQASVVDFFSSSAGDFLMQIGLDRVSEHYNKEQIKAKEREMRRHGRSAELLESAKKHAEDFQRSKARNAAFHHKLKRCQTCDFKTESQLVLEGHLLTPHFTQRRELQCSFCPFITRDAKAIIFHMEAHHNKVPVMEPPPQFYECPFCPFETNLKNKAGTHVNRCQRYFNNNVNQSPGNDFQAPGMTSKPITNEDIKMYEKFFIALTQAKNQRMVSHTEHGKVSRLQGVDLDQEVGSSRSGVQSGGQGRSAQQQQQQQAAVSQASLLQQAQAIAQAAGAGLLNGGSGAGANGGLPSLAAHNRVSAAAAAANLARIPQQQAADPRAPKDLYVDEYDYKYKFKQFCADGSSRWCCTNRKCKAAFVIPRGESKPRFPVGPDMHNHKAYKVAEPLDAAANPGAAVAAQLEAAGVNMQALAALTNGGTNTQALAAAGGRVAPSGWADISDGRLPDKAELVPGVATRLSAPGTGRAPVILESSGQGSSGAQTGANAYVICEICDGFIKDLEYLRTHMQWIHKVKIHPKMMVSRPPLSCQKCQWRFFTDQGLERHLLGVHGLVTSNMQELANNGQDGGRCTVCGRIYERKLVAHMSQVHRVMLKPAHLSYKCTVCTATFNLYRLFESHVYSVHSGAMKRGSTSVDQGAAKRKKEDRRDDSGSSGLNLTTSNSSSLHASSKASSSSGDAVYPKTCALCNGVRVEDFLQHLADKHMPKSVKVGVCQIEKCSSCLSNFDGMVVMNSDLGESSSSDDDDDD
ncbi:hypothetical protein BIW11_11993 [Tropilaelaps mercedesae]|uniref:MOG interacting and ectopic P-granules protein 1 n=1 Tax=Tropilaelaps mercedesae TaxID=418985 RepID=A0A1V9X8N0_9ACAR|nr:hypothetical protein BIW11_11993 [Tropilaelaps mercedesae]